MQFALTESCHTLPKMNARSIVILLRSRFRTEGAYVLRGFGTNVALNRFETNQRAKKDVLSTFLSCVGEEPQVSLSGALR